MGADPVSLTIMAAAAATSAIASGIEQHNQLKGQSKALKQQARLLEQQEKRTRLEGSLNEDAQRAQNRQAMANSRAMMSEMGIGDSVTAINVLAQDAANAEQNALNMRYRTDTEAANYQQQAGDARFGAKQAKKQARRAFYMGLLQGGADAFKTYAGNKTPTDPGAKDAGNSKSGFSWLWGSNE